MRKTELFTDESGLHLSRYRRKGYLTRADAVRFLGSLRSDVADVVFIDPPFNLGKDYGIRSALESSDPGKYESYMCRVIDESQRVLKPGGALFLYHLPYWAAVLTSHLMVELELRHWIAIAMKNGFVRQGRLYPAHYALLYYTKGRPAHFARPRIEPLTCRHCGRWLKDYGGYSRIIRDQGVNLSDVWEDLSPVRHAPNKHRSANQLPQGLTDRVMQIAGPPDGLLIDPFVGTGTSLVSAVQSGMRFVGNDLAARSIRICQHRLDRLREHGAEHESAGKPGAATSAK